MKKLIETIFSEKSVFKVNAILFFVFILFGAVIYKDKIHGGSDDMSNISGLVGNGSILEYVKWYYLNWGQTGIVVLIASVQFIVKLFHITPEGFPWWFFVSINIFCYVAAVYMIVMGGKRLLKYEWQEALFLLFFIYGFWFTPVVYKSTISMMPVTLFFAFELPTYLLTIAMYLFSANTFGRNKKDWLIFGFIYLFLSFNTETFLMTTPVLFTGIVIVRAFQERFVLSKIPRYIGVFAVLSLVSVVFTWTQPGYHLRQLNLDFHVPSFLEVSHWYLYVVQNFEFVSIVENFPNLAYFILFLPLFFLLIIILGLWILDKCNVQVNSLSQIRLLLLRSMWSLVLMLGFLFCMIPLLFTDYYPYYLTVYPTLLTSVALGGIVGMLIYMPETIREFSMFFRKSDSLDMDITLDEKPLGIANFHLRSVPSNALQQITKNWHFINYYSFLSLARWIGASAILLILFLFISLPNFKDILRIHRIELISSAVRADFQEKIVSTYYITGQKNYLIMNCAERTYADQFWGVNGYLYWKGIKDGFGVLDTDVALHGLSPKEIWPDKKTWYKINCLQLTKEQRNYLKP